MSDMDDASIDAALARRPLTPAEDMALTGARTFMERGEFAAERRSKTLAMELLAASAIAVVVIGLILALTRHAQPTPNPAITYPTASATVSPSGTPTSSPPAATPVPPSNAASAMCSISHLRITRQMVSSGTFHTTWIYFIQTNGAACQLSGAPTLELRDTHGVIQIHNSPLSTNAADIAITISSQAYASFYTVEDCGNPDVPPTTFGTIEVTLRSVSTLLVISVAGPSQSCTVDAGVSAMQTGTVQPQGLGQLPSITPVPWH